MMPFHSIIYTAINNGWLQRDPFYAYRITKEETKRRFLTKEEIELLVNYTMPGYTGLDMTIRNRDWDNRKPYKCDYLDELTGGSGQAQFYVTETGSSWAGVIEKAVFRYYPYEFEEYLATRGAWEESRKESKERLKAIKEKPGNLWRKCKLSLYKV